MTTANTYTTIIDTFTADIRRVCHAMETDKGYTLTAARKDLTVAKELTKAECEVKGKSWGPILLTVSHVIGSSRAKFIERCKEALNNLAALTATHREHYGEDAQQAASCDVQLAEGEDADAHEADQVSTCFYRGSDVLEDSGVHVALPVCTSMTTTGYGLEHVHTTVYGSTYKCKTLNGNPLSEDMQYYITLKWDGSGYVDAGNQEPAIWAGTPVTAKAKEQSFSKRTVAVLNEAGMGTHSVYIHWFRIDYGCWLDAEEVVKNGGLAEHLEWLGMREADVAELMTRDWDCQDADGLAYQCLTDHGGFDWVKLERLLEAVDAGYDTEIVQAALSLGIPADEVAEAYIGEWNSDEDMAMERWEQYGMLESIPEAARGYIDWELVARDMLLSGIAGRNGHYFYAC